MYRFPDKIFLILDAGNDALEHSEKLLCPGFHSVNPVVFIYAFSEVLDLCFPDG